MNEGEEGAKSNVDGENQPRVPIARGTSHLEAKVNQMKTIDSPDYILVHRDDSGRR